MLFQALSRFLTVLLCFAAISQPANQLACKGKVALRLDPYGDQVRMQRMSQSPGIADDLAGVRTRVETHQDTLTRCPHSLDAMFGHVLLKLLFCLLSGTSQRHFT